MNKPLTAPARWDELLSTLQVIISSHPNGTHLFIVILITDGPSFATVVSTGHRKAGHHPLRSIGVFSSSCGK